MKSDFLRRVQARGIIHIPPLADRIEDIELLAEHFLAKRNTISTQKLSFSKMTTSIFRQYRFDRYNVSELQGAINHVFDNAIFEDSKSIEVRHFSKELIETLNLPIEANDTKINKSDEEEFKILSCLRSFDFNITRTEQELGYASGSKTLTNHLRGIIYKTLDLYDLNLDSTLSKLLGDNLKKEVEVILRNKITDYISFAKRHIKERTTQNLFVKLPQRYRVALENVLKVLKKQS